MPAGPSLVPHAFTKDNTLEVTNVDYFWTSLCLPFSFPTSLSKANGEKAAQEEPLPKELVGSLLFGCDWFCSDFLGMGVG